VASFTGFTALLALPSLLTMRDFLHSNIVSFDPLANLVRPLTPLQLAGIWPTGDFRFDPAQLSATRVLIAVAIAAAAAGVAIAARRGAPELSLYVVGALVSALALNHWSTPWIAGKAFATASPAIPLAALTTAVVLLRSRRVVEGAVLAVVLVGAVLWSNVLQYHDAWLAPREQLQELSSIGDDFAGASPSLITEYQPYGVATCCASSTLKARPSSASARCRCVPAGRSTRASTPTSTPSSSTGSSCTAR
jgi:hypothetical protein